MGKTSISWTEFSVNPIRYRANELSPKGKARIGHYCEKVSAGCLHCYASEMQRGPYLSGLEYKAENKGKGEHFFEPKAIEQVLRRRKPTEWFWCDMTDLFGDWVPDEWIALCFATMVATPQHTHITITKRPERMRKWFDWISPARLLAGMESAGIKEISGAIAGGLSISCSPRSAMSFGINWPPKNWVAGITAENQEQVDKRLSWLLQTPATCRIVSVEPLLEAVDLERYLWGSVSDTAGYFDKNGHRRSGGAGGQTICSSPLNALHGIIIGGESGPRARPCNVEHIRSLIRQCKAAGADCFVKQLGSNYVDAEGAVGGHQTTPPPEYTRMPWFRRLKDRKGGDMSEWPEDLRVRELPWRSHA